MSAENIIENNETEESQPEATEVSQVSSSNTFRNIIGSAVIAGAALTPLQSEAQLQNTSNTLDSATASWVAKVKQGQLEQNKAAIEMVKQSLQNKYPEARFEYGTNGRCLGVFGGDIYYNDQLVGHIENNCGNEHGPTVALGQAMKMLDGYITRIERSTPIKTTPEIEERLKLLRINISGTKFKIFENRGGKIIWTNVEFDKNTAAVDIVPSHKHPHGVRIVAHNKDNTVETLEIYPDQTNTANIVEGF